ncbi:hypothetical protein G8B24_01365, partial [Limosilactobacillus reuteri]
FVQVISCNLPYLKLCNRTIETQWSWISWIFLLLLFVLPDMYTAILICVITLIETWVVYELYNAREYAKKINEK